MDNQKPQQGNGSNVGSEGSGSSMGKELSKELGGSEHVTSKTVGFGNLDNGIDKSLDKSIDKSIDKVDKSIDSSASQMHATIDKAADAAKPMADRIATTAHAGVDKLSSALSGAGARFEGKSKELSEVYGRYADTGRDYVRTKPATAVLIALAAGYTLSKLLGRRR